MDLILDVDAGHAGFLKHLDGVMDVHGIAVTGIGVGGQGDRERAREHPAVIDVFRQPHEANIVDAEKRVGDACSGRRRHFEASLFHQPGAVAVIHTRRNDQPSLRQQLTEFPGAIPHFNLSTVAGFVRPRHWSLE
jgi:hypothetical protein